MLQLQLVWGVQCFCHPLSWLCGLDLLDCRSYACSVRDAGRPIWWLLVLICNQVPRHNKAAYVTRSTHRGLGRLGAGA